MAPEEKKSEERSPKKGTAKVVKKKAPKPTDYFESTGGYRMFNIRLITLTKFLDSEEAKMSSTPAPSPSPGPTQTKNDITKLRGTDFEDIDELDKQGVLITAAERIKMRRRNATALKKQKAAAARFPEFDEDSDRDDKNKIERKTLTADPKKIKPTKSSNTTTVTAKMTNTDKSNHDDDHHGSPLRKPDTTQKHTEKQSNKKVLAVKKEKSSIRKSNGKGQILVGDTAKKNHHGEQQKRYQKPPTTKLSNSPRTHASSSGHFRVKVPILALLLAFTSSRRTLIAAICRNTWR